MTAGHVFPAISVDGFVARRSHALDWLESADQAGEDLGVTGFMDRIDVIATGRGSFETLLTRGDWPYPFPAVALSHSMRTQDIPEALRGKVRLSRQTPEGVMTELAAEGRSRIYVDGGRLAPSFIRAGTVADMTLTMIPVLPGEGPGLFGPLDGDIRLILTRSKAFPSGIMQNEYAFAAS